MAEQTTMQKGPSPLLGKRVYIVEDDVFLGDLIVDHMQKENINITRLLNAEKALEAIKNDVPDIILLDIYLPGINGLEFLEVLRNDPRTKKIPVVIVSNTDQAKDRERAANLGAEFMLKAITTPAKIVKFMEEIISRKPETV